VNESEIGPVSEHFTAVALRDGLPIGKPLDYDENLYRHQVPGGMISNLKHQLKLVGMEDKIEATLEEAALVRKEFGYPIMVTPLSQFVGTQAAFNVITGERYREVTDQTIQYALGIWGREGAELMDSQVKDKILSRPRAKKWENWVPPDPSLKEMREKFGGPGVSDEELILRFYAGPEAADEVLKVGAPQAKLDANQPLTKLVQELSARNDLSYVRVEKAGFAVTLGKEAND
jgi:oxaloacetate decarboxylase alpha subunit